MSAPVRLKLSRVRGFDLQALSCAVNGLAAVNVARPSIFGNPWRVESFGAAQAVALFSSWLRDPLVSDFYEDPKLRDWLSVRRALILGRLPELRGRNLACWCVAGAPCHADVLIDLANRAASPQSSPQRGEGEGAA